MDGLPKEYVPIALRENIFANSEIESIPSEDEISVSSQDWLDFLDGVPDVKYTPSQQSDYFNNYIGKTELDDMIFSQINQMPEFNYQGYEMAVENINQDSDELYDRLPDEIDYGEMYDNSSQIDN